MIIHCLYCVLVRCMINIGKCSLSPEISPLGTPNSWSVVASFLPSDALSSYIEINGPFLAYDAYHLATCEVRTLAYPFKHSELLKQTRLNVNRDFRQRGQLLASFDLLIWSFDIWWEDAKRRVSKESNLRTWAEFPWILSCVDLCVITVNGLAKLVFHYQ